MPEIPTTLSQEISDIYTVENNTFLATPKENPKDKIDVEIGDSKQTDFLPQVKVQRWDNEVNFSVRLVHEEETPTVSTVDEKIIWDGDKVAANFYDVPMDENNPEGGYEFEVILKEQPKSNVVQFTLVDKGLEYFYQPELTEEEISQGAERPENVVGSYAVYASENKTNYVGGKEYKCGKVGHIYRPRIEDAENNWVWGELLIKDGILSVTIPQEFLDKAVYPVRHAAGLTFGYTTIPTYSYWAISNDKAAGLKVTSPSNISGATINKLTAYCRMDYSSGTSFKSVIFKASDGTLITNAVGGATLAGASAAWLDSSFGVSPSLENSTDYYLMIIQQPTGISIIIYYDNAASGGYTATNSYATPTNATITAQASYKYGVYATYHPTVANQIGTVQALVVGGGGGGGGTYTTVLAYTAGGGGGGGGVQYDDIVGVAATSYTVTVGDGGAGGVHGGTDCRGTNGANSVFSMFTALGGGGGGGAGSDANSTIRQGRDGGSGGG